MRSFLKHSEFQKLIIIPLLFNVFFVTGQTPFSKLLNKYEANNRFPKEIAYLHLNKTILVQGEQLAFKAYLWDRSNNRPAKASRNLYVQLKNQNDSIVREQLVLLSEGVGNGFFEMDSSLTASEFYKITAFTNYMRNFKEPGLFEERFFLINPEEPQRSVTPKDSGLTLEILPEGGNYLQGEETTFGIKATGLRGSPTGNLSVIIKDGQGNEVNSIHLDRFGEGRFPLKPEKNKRYYAHVKDIGSYPLPPPKKDRPFSLKIYHLNNNLGIRLKTSAFPEGRMILAIHNGKMVKALDVDFKNREATLVIPKSDLFPGMNVFTLSDEQGTSQLERYYYHFEQDQNKIPVIATAERIGEDSVRVVVKNLGDNTKWHSLSATVLPENTKSYERNHNISSYTSLIPFTWGQLTIPKRYFEDPLPKLVYALNNALITVRRPFFWDQILDFEPKMNYPVEDGLTLIGQPNNNAKHFVLGSTYYSDAQTGILDEKKNTFTIRQVYPLVDERLVLSEVAKNGAFKKPGLFLRFKPSYIPNFTFPNLATPVPSVGPEVEIASSFSDFKGHANTEITELDEVEVVAKRNEARRERIKNRTQGRVDFFEKDDPRLDLFLSAYLGQFGFNMTEQLGQVTITARNPLTPNNVTPAVYLDGIFLNDFNILYRFRLDIVDHIIINKSGVGSGLFGGGGVIKIYTDPEKRNTLKTKVYDFGYKAPLGFAPPKTYRRPEYLSYKGRFFSDFGILSWKPNLQLGENDTLVFTVWNPYLETLKISLEGVINNNELFSKELIVTLPAD